MNIMQKTKTTPTNMGKSKNNFKNHRNMFFLFKNFLYQKVENK